MSSQLKYCIRVALAAFMVIAVAVIYLPRNTQASASNMQVSSAATMNGHGVAADFLAYWNTHGGLAINGYPITDEQMEVSATDGKSYATQWFERARYERHPENVAANRVQLGLLGAEFVQGKSFAAANSTTSNGSIAYFAETKHSLSDSPAPFKSYWQQNGGLAQFGYPLSEQVKEVSTDGKTYTVQYFERQRFEFHPEQSNAQYRVMLGLLGVQIHNRKGGNHNQECRPASSGAPLPEPTGTAESTPQPHATCTPEPTHQCEHECQTPEPTETAQPEPTHQCEHECQTPEPTETAQPEPTHQCEHECQTPEPTETAQPEPTHQCEHECQTPQPTETHNPEPTHTEGCDHECQTPQPTETHNPEPTRTPEPTETHNPEPTQTQGCDHECQTPQPTETHNPEPTQTPGCEHSCEPSPTPRP